ncbi:MAG: SOS response-associated peptidase [Phycisphaerales bacterium]|nr:SOS response-associated peptidase [Phycisphaerales bacterium]
MCGRFTHLYTWNELHALLSLSVIPSATPAPRHNVAPGQLISVVREDGSGARVVDSLHWGFVPAWAGADFAPLINARSETAAVKPAFADALATRRCIVPASGFYEWATAPGERAKIPYYFRDVRARPLLFAGLWSPSVSGSGTVAILTTAATGIARTVHERLPVMLEPEEAQHWLASSTRTETACALVQGNRSPHLRAFPVSRLVNRVEQDGPALIEPVGPDLDAEGPRPSEPHLFSA